MTNYDKSEKAYESLRAEDLMQEAMEYAREEYQQRVKANKNLIFCFRSHEQTWDDMYKYIQTGIKKHFNRHGVISIHPKIHDWVLQEVHDGPSAFWEEGILGINEYISDKQINYERSKKSTR